MRKAVRTTPATASFEVEAEAEAQAHQAHQIIQCFSSALFAIKPIEALLVLLFPSAEFQNNPIPDMRPTVRLLQHACRITLFTRANCQLCVNAKQVLSNVWDQRHFEYKELDVMTPEGKSWRDLYEFDTPVVSNPSGQTSTYILMKCRFMSAPQKCMRRFPDYQRRRKS